MRTFIKKTFSLYAKIFAVMLVAAGALLAACEEPPGAEPAKASKTQYILISDSPIAKLNTLYKLVSDIKTLPSFDQKYSNGKAVDTVRPVYHASINGTGGTENYYVWASSDGYRITQAAPQAQGADEWLLEDPQSDPKAPDPTQVVRWLWPKAGKSAADVVADPYNADPNNPTYGEAPFMNVSPQIGIKSVSITQPDAASNPLLLRVSVLFDEAVEVVGSPTFTINVGGADVPALYVSGSAESTLVFEVTLTGQTGQVSSADNAIAPKTGAIKDMNNKDAITTDTFSTSSIVIGAGGSGNTTGGGSGGNTGGSGNNTGGGNTGGSGGNTGGSGQQPTAPAATSVAVSPKNPSIIIGGTVQLSAVVSPTGADQSVTWSSSNNNIATVSGGLVQGIGAGTATITATTANGQSDTATISVARPDATGISVSPKTSTITAGGSTQLSATVTPATADQSVTWSSGSNSIATVDQTGRVTGVAQGSVTITARSSNGQTDSAVITVNAAPSTGVTVSPKNVNVAIGATTQLSASVAPASANQRVTWTSSNTGIATVSASGVVQGVATGSATITATSTGGQSDSAAVTVVRPAPTGVTVAPKSVTMIIGATTQLSATVAPAAADQTVSWTSGSSSIATVDQNGRVTAVAAGTVTITARSTNGFTDFASITVNRPTPASVTVSPSTASVTVGGFVQLSASVAPSNADQSVTWTSGNTGVATVSSSGLVQGIAAGSATITATSSNGQTDTASITVTRPDALSVTVTPATTSVTIGATTQLSASVAPSTADQSVTWRSDNTGIATVSASGLVTGTGVGNATITATSSNGRADSAVVTVNRPAASGVTVSPKNTSVTIGATTQLSASVAPSTANQSVTWTSDNTGIATVSSTGLVQGVAAGTATITATNTNGQSDSATVTVNRPKPTAITINPKTRSINKSDTIAFNTTVSPSNAEPGVTYASSNAAIVSVDARGNAQGVGYGTATITARSTADSSIVDTATITVLRPAAVSVTPSETTATVSYQGFKQFSATVSPPDADQTLSWSITAYNPDTSDTRRYITIDNTGGLSGGVGGQVTVTVRASNGVSANITVNVEYAPAYSITINTTGGRTFEVFRGASLQLVAVVTPRNADQNVSWSSDRPDIATVNQSGLVEALAQGPAGRVVITATAKNGVRESAAVRVAIPGAQSTTITPGMATMARGSTETPFTATVSPAGADQTIAWSSSDTNIASINRTTGEITALRGGTVTITATPGSQTYGGATATLTVTQPAATNVDVTPASSNIILGSSTNGSVQLSASVSPANADPSVTWSSSNASIATVNANGLVTGTSNPGTVTITATTPNGASDTATITVSRPAATRMDISPSSVTMMRTDIRYLTATVFPAEADQTVIWSSSAPNTVSVGRDTGAISGLRGGTAVITATTSNGVTGSVNVTITTLPPTGVTVTPDSPTIYSSSRSSSSRYFVQLTATVSPKEAEQDVTWSSGNQSLASVDSTGMVRSTLYGNDPGGTVTITATTPNGVSGSTNVTVRPYGP